MMGIGDLAKECFCGTLSDDYTKHRNTERTTAADTVGITASQEACGQSAAHWTEEYGAKTFKGGHNKSALRDIIGILHDFTFSSEKLSDWYDRYQVSVNFPGDPQTRFLGMAIILKILSFFADLYFEICSEIKRLTPDSPSNQAQNKLKFCSDMLIKPEWIVQVLAQNLVFDILKTFEYALEKCGNDSMFLNYLK